MSTTAVYDTIRSRAQPTSFRTLLRKTRLNHDDIHAALDSLQAAGKIIKNRNLYMEAPCQ